MLLTSDKVSVVVLFLASLQVCKGRRLVSKPLGCPSKPEVNVKGDCVDGDAAIVPARCCAILLECSQDIAELDNAYTTRFALYWSACAVEESDIEEDNGIFNIVDSTRICSEECQRVAELAEPAPRDNLQALRDICKDTRAASELEALVSMVAATDVLNSAWNACRTTTSIVPSHNDGCGDGNRTLAASRCSQGDHVPCPWTGVMCAGDQCCPGAEATNGETFTCPSASRDNVGCNRCKQVDCLAAPATSHDDGCGSGSPTVAASQCSQGDHVPCPWTGVMCAGDQCCPGAEATNGETFTCPSASRNNVGCDRCKQVDCSAGS